MSRTLAFVALAVAACGQTAVPGNPGPFDQGLRSVQGHVDRGRWKEARAALLALLEAHRESDGPRGRLVELEGLMEKIVFQLQNPAPDPKSLISGELLSWTPASGRIKLRYTPGNLGDFEKGGERVHPLRFAGPYSVEVKGASYPAGGSGIVLLAGLDEKQGFAVVFGRAQVNEGTVATWVPARLRHLRDGADTDLDTKETSPSRPGKPYRVRVDVTATSVTGSYNGRPVLTGKKPKGLWGHAGYDGGIGAFEEIVFEGQAETAWIQGLVDAAVQKQMEAFKPGWSPRDHLPIWLYAAATAKPALKRAPRREWPAEIPAAGHRVVGEIVAHLNGGRFEEGLAAAGSPEAGALPGAVRDHLLAELEFMMGRAEEALGHARKVLAADPEFVPAAEVAAGALRALGKDDEAVKARQALVDAFPGEADLHAGHADLLLDLGRATEARETVQRAVGLGLRSARLDALNRIVVRAAQGPPFRQRFEAKSANYVVVSDIDKKTCDAAAAILEESYLAYRTYLEPVKDIERRKFQVFLFSGQEGYKAYCQDLWGDAPEMTAGLYTPGLKQLLIWNLPSRADMMRTVRHEGFHQYLDRLMRDPPLWFNEGLAEYYETSVLVNGAWKLGEVRKDHLETLGMKLMPMKEFLYRPHHEFQADPAPHYAQSWAFIHFLRHGKPERKKLFDAFWEAFRTMPDSRAALDRVLASVDGDALVRDFQAHVQSLR